MQSYPGQVAHRSLMIGSLVLISLAVLTGLCLELSPGALLAMHLTCAAGSAGVLGAFLWRHAWQRRGAIGDHPNSPMGYLAVLLLTALAVSGGALLWATNVEPLRWLHNAATCALVAILGAHSLWRVTRRASYRASAGGLRPRLLALPAGLLLSASLAAVVIAPGAASEAVSPPSPSQPLIRIEHGVLGQTHLPQAIVCASCHADAAAQWRSSLHAKAATNDYYLAVTALFIAERGAEAVRYCAACHNPIGLMQGEVDGQAAQGATGGAAGAHDAARPGSNKAYESRALGIHLPHSEAAAEGVTCTICHLAVEAGKLPNNGNLALQPAAAALPQSGFGRLALRAAPNAHRSQFAQALLSEAALCGSCHNVYTEAGAPLEPTYDEWLASPYPGRGETCQSCHMPSVRGRRADGGLIRSVSAHGGIPGAPSSLPDTAHDTSLLRKAAELSLELEQGDAWRVTITVTNSGAGHSLPTGAADLRQVWLEVTLLDANGRVLQRRGGADRFGMLEPETVQFRKVLGDSQGKPVELHRFWTATQVLLDTRLAPLEMRRIPFDFAAPLAAQGPYTIEARLLYRDVAPSFAEFAQNRPVPDLPVREMASRRITVQGAE